MKKITLIQKVTTLNECLELIDDGKLPLVLQLTTQEFNLFSGDNEILDMMKKTPNIFPKVIPEKEILTFKNIEDIIKYNLASIYYGNFKTIDGYVYQFISNIELMNLIQNKKIYINEFIDYYGNKRCISNLYPQRTRVKTGGIIFKNRLRVFGEIKDSGKLKNMPVISGIIEIKDINHILGNQNNYMEMDDLCLETVRLTEKQKHDEFSKMLTKN